jgi:hypothetical protein
VAGDSGCTALASIAGMLSNIRSKNLQIAATSAQTAA